MRRRDFGRSLASAALWGSRAICAANKPFLIGFANGGLNWPLFVASAGDYYAKYGLSAELAFSPHPAGMAMLVSGQAKVLHYSLEQALQAAASQPSLRFICSLINRGAFALLAWSDIKTLNDLKGKRIGIGQVGDANFGFAASILATNGVHARETEWIPLGSSVETRVAALLSRRVDAAMLTAPSYFRIENTSIRILIDFAKHPEIYASSVLVVDNRVLKEELTLGASLIQAHADSIERFYRDKQFAIASFLKYQPMFDASDVARMYDLYALPRAFERVPYVLGDAIRSVIRQEADPQIKAKLTSINLREVVQNRFIDGLIGSGFFEKTFGPAIRKDLESSRTRAFR